MPPPDPRLASHVAPGETVLHHFRPDPAGAKPWGSTLLTALWSMPMGGTFLYLSATQPPDFAVPWFVSAPVGCLFLAIAPAERRIARRKLDGMLGMLTQRQLLLLAPEAAPRGIGPYDIRRIEVARGPGRLGTLHLRPALATLPALREPDAAARRIAAWAEDRTVLWRDWTLARLAEAAAGTPDRDALALLARPDLGLTIALPHEWRVEVRDDAGRWTTLHRAEPGWTALRAEGAASSRFELAVPARPIADARAAVLAALDDGAGAAAEDIVLGPWRGVAATGRAAGTEMAGVQVATAERERPAARALRRIVATLFTARAARRLLPTPAPPRRSEIRREILLDAAPRQIRLSLTGHADAPEAWAVLEAAAAALRPA